MRQRRHLPVGGGLHIDSETRAEHATLIWPGQSGAGRAVRKCRFADAFGASDQPGVMVLIGLQRFSERCFGCCVAKYFSRHARMQKPIEPVGLRQFVGLCENLRAGHSRQLRSLRDDICEQTLVDRLPDSRRDAFDRQIAIDQNAPLRFGISNF